MPRRKTTKERQEIANAKKMHKKDQRLNPTWFEARQIDLASELVKEIATSPPKWGGLSLTMKKKGNATERLLKFF